MTRIGDEELKFIKSLYEGFKITCENCGSESVTVVSNVGFSDESGAWGSVGLLCLDCKNSKSLWDAA